MQVAQKMENGSYKVGTLQELFPDVSFPANSEPNAVWYLENNILKINLLQQYDPETQILESVAPYETGDGWVYITRVIDKPAGI